MDFRKLFIFLTLFLSFGLLLVADASSQSRFDSGDGSDDLGGSDSSSDDSDSFDSGDDSSNSDSGRDSSSDSDRFESGDGSDDSGSDSDQSSDNSNSGDSSGGSDSSSDDSSRFDSGDDSDDSNEQDSENFDSGDESDDAGSDGSGSGTDDQGDEGSRFDSGDDSDDSVDNGTRFDSGDSEDDAGDNGSRFDGGDSSDDTGDDGSRFDSGDSTDEGQDEQEEEDDGDEASGDGNNQDSEDDSNDTTSDQDEDQTGNDGGNDDSDNDSGDDNGGSDDSDDGGSLGGSGGSGGGEVIDIDPISVSDSDISLQLSPTSVAPGGSVSVTGAVDAEGVEGMEAEIFLNDQQVGTATLDEQGEFSSTVSSDQVGENTVRVDFRDASQSTRFNVAGDVSISRIVTSGEMSSGDTIQVCPQIDSAVPAQVRFYANDQIQGTRTGSGEVCFDVVLQDGSNVFRVEASLGGNTVSDTIVRSADGMQIQDFQGGVDGTPDQGITGDFSSNFPQLPQFTGFDLDLANLSVRWLFSILIAVLLAAGILL